MRKSRGMTSRTGFGSAFLLLLCCGGPLHAAEAEEIQVIAEKAIPHVKEGFAAVGISDDFRGIHGKSLSPWKAFGEIIPSHSLYDRSSASPVAPSPHEPRCIPLLGVFWRVKYGEARRKTLAQRPAARDMVRGFLKKLGHGELEKGLLDGALIQEVRIRDVKFVVLHSAVKVPGCGLVVYAVYEKENVENHEVGLHVVVPVFGRDAFRATVEKALGREVEIEVRNLHRLLDGKKKSEGAAEKPRVYAVKDGSLAPGVTVWGPAWPSGFVRGAKGLDGVMLSAVCFREGRIEIPGEVKKTELEIKPIRPKTGRRDRTRE